MGLSMKLDQPMILMGDFRPYAERTGQIMKLLHDIKGATYLEYALTFALIGITVIAAVTMFGEAASTSMTEQADYMKPSSMVQ